MDDESGGTTDGTGNHHHESEPGEHGASPAAGRSEQTLLESEARASTPHGGDHGAHRQHDGHHEGHGGMHEGYEALFRRRFFVSTLLSVPVLLYSETLQAWLGFSVPGFPGSEWVNPVFAVAVFAYGGVPFLRMAVRELNGRAPGMMTLISMAIAVAFVALVHVRTASTPPEKSGP